MHLDDAELAANRRGRERHRASGAQLAVGVNRDLERTFCDDRRRHGIATFGQSRHRKHDRRAERQRRSTPMAATPRAPPRHSDLLIISGDGRRVAIRSPGSMPDATIACSLPRFVICTRRSWNSEPSSS